MEWEVVEEGVWRIPVEVLKCPKCGQVLARRTVSGGRDVVHSISDCEHYRWAEYGNICFAVVHAALCKDGCPLGLDEDARKECIELVRKEVERLDSGTTVYVLVPR